MASDKQKRLLIMAGGTGGHVFPALAVAQELIKEGWDICWLGTRDRMEAELVPKNGIKIEFIQISGLVGKGKKALLKAPFAICKATLQARKIIKEYKPHAVLGMGGYVSGPGGLAAKLCGVPIILHEQNAVVGLTNKLLAKIASQVLQAFPNTFKEAKTVGNPVRKVFFEQQEPRQRLTEHTDKTRILIVGGSQGARVLNQTVPEVYKKLANQGEKLEIFHQVGKGNIKTIKPLYPNDSNIQIAEFIDDMAQAYSWADIVICRSGALTVCEIAAVGVPAIFIPFQHKDRQQYLNAKFLAEAGGAEIIEQSELTVAKLADLIEQLDKKKRIKMAEIAKEKANPTSAREVAQTIIKNAK